MNHTKEALRRQKMSLLLVLVLSIAWGFAGHQHRDAREADEQTLYR